MEFKLIEKIILAMCLASGISACTSTATVDKYEGLAEASRERSARLGELPGTPDNVDAIRNADQQAQQYESQAHHARKHSSFMAFVTDAIFDLILD